jgi:aryl-alcohol dehydrogenase-like predicted oxidoreductase
MFGAWPIAGRMGAVDRDTAIATVRRAVELGITAIDTAEGYAESEAMIGEALADRPREESFLATKVSFEPFTRERISAALDRSLRSLRTDYVDLYQLHRFPSDAPLEEALAGLREAQESGKARHVGVSNFTVDQLEAARALYPIQSLQPRFSIFSPEAAQELLPYCRRHDIGVIVHSPLAKGLLTGKYRPDDRFAAGDERAGFPRFQGETFASYLALADELATLARANGISLVQLAIAWTLANPAVTSCIVGARSPGQVEEQLGALEVRLTSDTLDRIADVAARASALPA